MSTSVGFANGGKELDNGHGYGRLWESRAVPCYGVTTRARIMIGVRVSVSFCSTVCVSGRYSTVLSVTLHPRQ